MVVHRLSLSQTTIFFARQQLKKVRLLLPSTHASKITVGNWRKKTIYAMHREGLELNEGWFNEASQNQAMRFGDLPEWAMELSDAICESVLLSDAMDLGSSGGDEETCAFPSDLLWRKPLFNQLIVNLYKPGEGICAHVDLLRFEDGIAIVSLESSCVMHFTRVERIDYDIVKEGQLDPLIEKVPVLLTPGSLVLLSGEARYLWKHEINRLPGFQMWEGQELNQMTRMSITLRKLCKT
ncbi:alkylated DNA repair protein alkB-like 8 [Quillaja saponaria]|uniref:Alkylated DNA repair protein alkB-like 8 n=1 Tax=Quillaja saponaria TaxID=32244 RepID=A0AAD7Q145_QUISA|nr:alkylated DNA repair protein alkB-like 8 [Quillaja saponaria]